MDVINQKNRPLLPSWRYLRFVALVYIAVAAFGVLSMLTLAAFVGAVRGHDALDSYIVLGLSGVIWLESAMLASSGLGAARGRGHGIFDAIRAARRLEFR